MRGHAEHDAASYVPEEMLEEYANKDPVDTYVRWLARNGGVDVDVDALKQAIAEEVAGLWDPSIFRVRLSYAHNLKICL